jgi:hypothetical protein
MPDRAIPFDGVDSIADAVDAARTGNPLVVCDVWLNPVHQRDIALAKDELGRHLAEFDHTGHLTIAGHRFRFDDHVVEGWADLRMREPTRVY